MNKIFKNCLEKIEPFAKLGVEFVKTKQKTFSKFGGLPEVPSNFEWPMCQDNPIPFLLQVDFSEINSKGDLNYLPTQGLLYLFVDDEKINTEYDYKDGDTFKLMYFENNKDLIKATAPTNLGFQYKEFNVASKLNKTYPDICECEEVYQILDKTDDDVQEMYDDMRYGNEFISLIGGWGTYIQGPGFIDECKESDDDNWIMFMQINSIDDEHFMWGDFGNLYFYIRENDLKIGNFNNVKLEMQCT